MEAAEGGIAVRLDGSECQVKYSATSQMDAKEMISGGGGNVMNVKVGAMFHALPEVHVGDLIDCIRLLISPLW